MGRYSTTQKTTEKKIYKNDKKNWLVNMFTYMKNDTKVSKGSKQKFQVLIGSLLKSVYSTESGKAYINVNVTDIIRCPFQT